MTAIDTTTHLRRIAAIGGGLIGIAALAGCAPAAASSTGGGAAASSAASGTASSSASSDGSSSAAASGDPKDGSYTATGDYQSPAGASTIDVTVTLKSGDITAVKVIPKTQDPTAQQYEAQFASGVSAVAVGKRIAGLQVGAVSGSSLTSQGFEDALTKIRKAAA